MTRATLRPLLPLRRCRRSAAAVFLAVLGGLFAAFAPASAAEPKPATAETTPATTQKTPATTEQKAGSDDSSKETQPAEKAQTLKPEDLPAKYQQWLESVAILITPEERAAFLALQEDYQRDVFIERFWRARDTDRTTARNEFRERWENLLQYADTNFEGKYDERRKILLLNGPPTVAITSRCSLLQPLEVWFYAQSDQVPFEFFVVFYRPFGAGNFRIWEPTSGLSALTDAWKGAGSSGSLIQDVALQCPDGDKLAAAIAWVARQGSLGYTALMARMEKKPEDPPSEWVSTFDAYSTLVPAEAGTFDASLAVSYPGRHQSRTVVQGVVSVPVAEAGVADLAGNKSYNFLVNGEVLRDGELFESFRYKFDYPATQITSGTIPLVFERALRPHDYTLVVKVEDLNSGKFFHTEKPIDVPETESPPPPPEPADPESARLLAEANALLAEGHSTLKIVRPQGELITGMTRFDTLTTGKDIDHVTFALNGQPILTDRRPPYSVELDLGTLPRTHSLRATAYDAAGDEVANDEILVNSGGTRFRVRLTEPRKGKLYHDSLRARAELEVPAGETVGRLEFYLDETKVATLYGPPWEQPIVLPPEMRDGGSMGYVRAVAYLNDGSSTEDTVFVNAPDYMEEVDVQFVELYASVFDRTGRPVQGLKQADFRVTEDEKPQQIVRFEQVRDLPIHAGILLDVSASMDESLPAARDAALEFFQQILHPKDRAALITFNDHPNLAVKFTNQVDTLAGGLAGLKAERGTSLWDSVIFSLYYFNGIKGQKALLILSDGKDESSKFSFDDALEYARRAGVTIYTVGLDLPHGDPRHKLTKLAEETGGRSYFVDSSDELAAIYSQVEEELRSQYLVAYQSANPDQSGKFRKVDLQVDKPGLEVKTMTGYYP